MENLRSALDRVESSAYRLAKMFSLGAPKVLLDAEIKMLGERINDYQGHKIYVVSVTRPIIGGEQKSTHLFSTQAKADEYAATVINNYGYYVDVDEEEIS